MYARDLGGERGFVFFGDRCRCSLLIHSTLRSCSVESDDYQVCMASQKINTLSILILLTRKL